MDKPVLIVEGDAMCLSALGFLVMSAGHRPLAFPSGRHACAALEGLEDEPAALVTEFDLNSPCDSQCLISSMRQRYPTLPIIVLTADTSAAARYALERLDCHVLFKPSRPEEILNLLPAAQPVPQGAGA